MAKARIKKPKRTPTEAELVGEKARAIGVPEAQIARGYLAIVDVKLAAGEKVETNRTIKNRGASPIMRWQAAGLVSPPQMTGIEHCLRLWEIISSSGGMVANLDRTVFGSHGVGHPCEVEARDDLQKLRDYVGAKYWSIFENVIRFDEPAGVIGSHLETNVRNRETAARNCVLFVADMIAMHERLV